MVCGVEVSGWITGCIMGWVVMMGAPVSDRETGNGICMIPCGMVTMGPGFMMVGMAAALEMCISMPFCGEGSGSVNNRCTYTVRNPGNVVELTLRNYTNYRLSAAASQNTSGARTCCSQPRELIFSCRKATRKQQ
jgi:hypothetical protein